MGMGGRLRAGGATTATPRSFQGQAGLNRSGLGAISASAVAPTAACTAGSLVTVPAAAAMMTAPTPAQNHAPPWISGYIDTDARMTAAAAVRVSLGFTRRLPASFPRWALAAGRPRAGRPRAGGPRGGGARGGGAAAGGGPGGGGGGGAGGGGGGGEAPAGGHAGGRRGARPAGGGPGRRPGAHVAGGSSTGRGGRGRGRPGGGGGAAPADSRPATAIVRPVQPRS